MKRILLAAADRELTRFMAEALLERPPDLPPKATDPWDVARAHTALEAKLLVTRGGRPFDVILLDQELPGGVLELLQALRGTDEAAAVPIFLLTERGRDPHVRRLAVELHGVAGFLDRPVTADSLRETFAGLERRKRILLVEADDDRAERYRRALERVAYLVERVGSGREALDRAPRFRPDAAVASLELPDLRGLEVCVALKRAFKGGSLPVVLYGQLGALTGQGTEENAHRADDFVQAPFDDGILVERVAQLVGLGPGQALKRRRRKSLLSQLPPEVAESEQPTLSDLGRAVSEDEDPTSRGRKGAAGDTFEGQVDLERDDTEPPTPPPSASPAPVSPTRRTTRRVPCHTAMSAKNGAKVYRSRTLDISHGGIFFAAVEPLDIGERIDMAFKLPGAEETIRAVGKVCWVGRGGAEHVEGVGVKFSQIDPADLKAIVDYVNRVARVLYSASE